MIRPAAVDDVSTQSRPRRARIAARRWMAALAFSLLLHAAVAGAAWQWRGAWDLSLLPTQAGRASIALTASLAAQPEASPPEVEVVSEFEGPALPATEQERKEEQRAATAITRLAAEEESALRLLDPVEPVIVIVENAATPVVVGGLAERNETSRDVPPVGDSAATHLPLRRRVTAERALPSAASVPAPSSVAASGVDAENPPEIVLNRPPVYPADALAAGRTGRVVVRAEVTADGNVSEARLQRSSGVASLDRAAVAAVRGWRFSAAADVAAPPRRVDVPIDFVIRR